MAQTVRIAEVSSPPRRLDRMIGRAEIVLLAAIIAVGLATWVIGLGTLAYDYDEVMRAHSIWLAAQGLSTYRDFLDCHPPYFSLFTPIVHMHPEDPTAFMRSLRVVSTIGNLIFLGGLAALGWQSLSNRFPSRQSWPVLGLAVVAFHPAILEYLVEFRVDGWGYAVAAWSIYRFRRSPPRAYRQFELGAVTALATLLLCPKIAFLPLLVVIGEQIVSGRAVRIAALSVFGYLAGVAVAVVLFALYLAWCRMDLGRTFEILVRYNAVANANLSAVFGLLRTIAAAGPLTWLTVAGVMAWAVVYIRAGRKPDAYEAGVLFWLALQALIVAFPYKQYYGPWFLFASTFLAYLGLVLSDILGRARILVFVMACAYLVPTDLRTAARWSHTAEIRTQQLLIKWMNRVAHPGDRVVASPPFHPIYRFDSFFVWFNTFDPRGFDAQEILTRLPGFQPYVAAGRFRQELEENPPAIVVLSGDWRFVAYTKGQREALNRFLKERGYQAVQLGPARFAIRPDRLDQVRREGLL
jgi:hypothetical protein